MPQLRQLDLRLELRNYDDDFDLADYAYTFQLAPKLAKLSIASCHSVSRPLSLDHVRTLCIKHSELSRPDMETLLASCTGGLRAFSGWILSPEEIPATEMVKLLLLHGHGRTLADLVLVADVYAKLVWVDEFEAIEAPLTGFERLQRLVLDNRYVVDIADGYLPNGGPRPLRSAPPSLRSLQINGFEMGYLVDELDLLAGRKAEGELPDLAEVVMVREKPVTGGGVGT
ncbi:hypothetical protein PG984_003087 [Apiospora sp. TS-2023a]